MAEIKQVRLCGSGGQGIILAGTILGRAAFYDGTWVAGSNTYGAASWGGVCRAEVVISNKPITFPLVIGADVLIAMSQSSYNQYISDLNEDSGIVVYDEQLVTTKELKRVKQIGVSATKEAIDKYKSKQVASRIIMGVAI